MCGIAGLIALKQTASAELLLAMARTVQHRGPDDEGYLAVNEVGECVPLGGKGTPRSVFESKTAYRPTRMLEGGQSVGLVAGLAHRRLSIVDLSPFGHQPMCTTDRRLWIVYNGEVYNHVELRQELEAGGARFISTSDTEVILEAYRRWGTGCLDRFNGMFAFLILDVQARRLFAARDRFGVKPLYLWRSPKGLLAFASEIKQFAVLPGWDARVNGSRAYDFLVWGLADHTPETLFEGVFQLRGGEMLNVDSDQLARAPDPARLVKRWYRLASTPFTGTFEDAAESMRELLRDAVRLRLRADVPIGSCLSGGIDSSSIVCLMQAMLRTEGANELQKTFSAVSPQGRLDERRFIAAVVERTAVQSHSVQPARDEFLQILSDLVWHQDEPFGSSSIYAQWCVFKLARECGVAVMLDGQGADEYLAGYHAFFGPRLASLIRTLRLRALLQEIASLKALHGYNTGSALRMAAAALAPDQLLKPLRSLFGGTDPTPAWLALERLGAKAANPFAATSPGWRASIRALSHSQLTHTNLSMLLHWEDRSSMAHSIEARVPFVDYRLVEFALGLPDEFKVKNGMTKRVLRAAMRGTIPDIVVDRTDKVGFETSEAAWIRESSGTFRTLLEHAVARSGGILAPSALTVLDDFLEGRERLPYLLLRLITFGIWMDRLGVRAGETR